MDVSARRAAVATHEATDACSRLKDPAVAEVLVSAMVLLDRAGNGPQSAVAFAALA